MKYLLLAFALALTACAPAVVKTDPPVVIIVPPVIIPPPVIPPATIPAGPLVVTDASQVVTTLVKDVLKIELTPGVLGVWLRLTLPDGTPSPVTDTNGPCHCLGLGGASAHEISLTFLPGVLVSTSPSLDGPWTPAALTR